MQSKMYFVSWKPDSIFLLDRALCAGSHFYENTWKYVFTMYVWMYVSRHTCELYKRCNALLNLEHISKYEWVVIRYLQFCSSVVEVRKSTSFKA